MLFKKATYRNAWAWVPSLYFAEGIPYIVVMTVSVIMYKRMGISNTDIALYTSWLYLPWVIKPLWSPVVDLLKTKRFWIVFMQLFVGAGLAGVALTIPGSDFFRYTLAFFWLLAFSSATHDIAADGFYMLGLSSHDQAWFVGIRSTFYRIAMITGQGLIVIVAGHLETTSQNISYAWSITFFILAALFLIFCIYHYFILPFPAVDVVRGKEESKNFFKEFALTFVSFFKKKKIGVAIGFLLLYRFAEAQLVKIASPFLLDSREIGGLGLSTEEVGFVYGTVGIIALTLGGILGGVLAAKKGLKYWIWWMVLAINVPDLVYVYLSYALPENFLIVNICVAIEQFGYGIGFTAYMLYMIYISEGESKTAHFALTTGFMALGMMIPGMFSGWIQENIGYQHFFVWVCIATIPAFIITKFVDIDPAFGKKTDNNNK
ncbi:MAG TPA: MFS transporter [Ignavibacteriaceae bacterium]|jgi:PAT family beta-lactamase induction signal transducer AmpG|nr:MFS transporter [Ignavibacteriaceae bacterium]